MISYKKVPEVSLINGTQKDFTTRNEFMRESIAKNLIFYFKNPDDTYTELGHFDHMTFIELLNIDDLYGNRLDVVNSEKYFNHMVNYLQVYIFDNGKKVSVSNPNLYYVVPAATAATAAAAAGGKRMKSKRRKSKRRKSKRRNSKRRK